MPGSVGSGFAKLGDLLGGDSELEYEKGLNLGANTENALSQASERRAKAKAQSESEEAFVGLGLPRSQAHAMSVAQQAGGDFKDIGDILAHEQERGFREDAANPDLPFEVRNTRLMGVANAPVDRYQKVGNGADDRFDADGIQPLPGGAKDGGGSSAALQLLAAYGFLDENGQVPPEKREQAFDLVRSTERNVDFGGVPGFTTANPFHQGPKATPLSDPTTVGGNAGEIERQKAVGKGAGEAQNALPDQLADISKLRDSVNGLLGAKGFQGVYGNIQGQPLVRAITGLADSDIQDAQIRLKNIDAQTFGVAVQKMRGLGQLSNAEGTKVTDAYTRAVDPRLSESQAREAWNEVLDGLDLAEARAKRKAAVTTVPGQAPTYSGQHNDVKPAQPSGAPPPGTPVTQTQSATVPGAPRSFATEQEAAAAGLQDGTKIIVGGRPATWYN